LQFRLIFAYTALMSFHGAPVRLALVVSCKGCQRPVPAGVHSIPDNPVPVRCVLCREHRYYRPSEVYEGRVAFEVTHGGSR
jgi:hypothetical protein